MELSSLKKRKHPLVMLLISIPEITDSPTWIYSMEYQCFTLPVVDSWARQSPVLEQINLHIPSLSADIAADYRSVENQIPSAHTRDGPGALPFYSKNALCDTIFATINTELLAEQYLTEIQVTLPSHTILSRSMIVTDLYFIS
jgi:hypothetical protein